MADKQETTSTGVKVTIYPSSGLSGDEVWTVTDGASWTVSDEGHLFVFGTDGRQVASFHKDTWRYVSLVKADDAT